MPSFRLLVLGGFRLETGEGREISVSARKAQGVLGVLALAGPAGMARDRLSTMFWGELPSERARHSLRQLLSGLRRDADLVRANGELVALDAARCTVDALEFRDCAAGEDCTPLERAAALYCGPLLDGVSSFGDGFEEWLRVERARLAEQARGALARLYAIYAAAGNHESAAHAAQRALERDPVDEQAHRAAMRALDALGRRNAALEQYRICSESLTRQLGVEPQAETRALHDEILKTGAQAHATSHPLPLIAVSPLANLARVPELDALAASVAEDLSGHLARMPGFGVSAAASSVPGVRYLVTGSLRRPGPAQLRAAIQIVDNASGQYLWSAQQDLAYPVAQQELDDFIATSAARIEQQLTLSEAKSGRRGAWDRVRQATSALFTRGWSEEAVEGAVQGYRDAIAIDPTLAIARAQKALIMALGARWGLLRGEAAREEARAEAERALEMEPTRSEVLGYAGCAIADLGDPERALPLLERAVEENPGNAQAWAALGATHLLRHRLEEGVEALRRGLRVSPTDYRRAVWMTALAGGLARLNRLDEALEAAQDACRSDANFYPARIVLASVQARAGRTQEAGKALAEALRLRPRLTAQEVRLWAGRSLEVLAARLGLPGGRPDAGLTPD